MTKATAAVVRSEIAAARKRWGWTPSDLISLLRGGGNSSKGSEYERELCKRLSLWWTHGARDDVFWRSSGSGARAKVRGRGGVDTAGQHGDVAATDPIGAPFVEAFTTEIKRGYSNHTVQDIIDRPATAGVQAWDDFFAQTIESHEQAGSYAWLLITRRDRREALVWFPQYVKLDFRRYGIWAVGRPAPYIEMRATIRNGGGTSTLNIVCVTLDQWLSKVTPETITALMTFRRSAKGQNSV